MTRTRPAPSPDPSELHALVDGRLPPTQADELHAALDATDRQHAEAWQQQRAALQALHGDWLGRPMPTALMQAADRLQRAQTDQRRWALWGGVAAGWLLAFGLGWSMQGLRGSAVLAAAPPPPLRFAQQAAVAYAVFQPERRHPVEVAADQQEHLVQWLSRRLARPLMVPRLQDHGFELVGGRLLPGAAGTPVASSGEGGHGARGLPQAGVRAQFMYQDDADKRITLYLGALDGAPDGAFQFYQDGPVASFYWVERGFGYALSGELSRPALLALATAVHQQLLLAPAAPANRQAPAKGS